MNTKNLDMQSLDMNRLTEKMMKQSTTGRSNRISSGGVSTVRTSGSKKKGKTVRHLPYNFKLLSAQLTKAKTSLAARAILSKAYRQLVTLTGYKYATEQGHGEYDLDEIEAAIAHTRAVTQVARKKTNHLREEENIKTRQKAASSDLEDKNVDITQSLDLEDMLSETEENLEQMLQEFQAALESLDTDMMPEYQLSPEDLSADELSMALSENSFSEEDFSTTQLSSAENTAADAPKEEPLEQFRAALDLENLKKKHRSKEQRELTEADMKYLRFLFNKLAREKQETALIGRSNNEDASCGVSLELSGSEVPVAASEAPAPSDVASVVDVSV